jgi:adenine-specific DNA-methyltransferase
MFDFVEESYRYGQQILQTRPLRERKQHGQFLTPPVVARFMARQLLQGANGPRLLDPAVGSGVLATAVIEELIERRAMGSFTLTGYEVDRELLAISRDTLEAAAKVAAERNIEVQLDLREGDFISEMALRHWGDLWHRAEDGLAFDVIIANPPYFKLSSDASAVQMVRQYLPGHTNIYTLFMALAIELLSVAGRATFIVPRSFCSGAYFSRFRRYLIEHVHPTHVHVFQSRKVAFLVDAVLQENVIIQVERPSSYKGDAPPVRLSSSAGIDDLQQSWGLSISLDDLVGPQDGTNLFFRLPVTAADLQLLRTLDRWPHRPADYGVHISTGPVVPFRSRAMQTGIYSVQQNRAVPLLWLQHVKPGEVCWPLENFHKMEGLLLDAGPSLLVENENLVLVRRFSPKEAARRLVAAPWLAGDWPYEQIGIENHLNYIYRQPQPLTVAEAKGLAAYLNSDLVDRYFRLLNGHTQVNAGELRRLPMPSPEVLDKIGLQMNGLTTDVDGMVTDVLVETGYLPRDFPRIQESPV